VPHIYNPSYSGGRDWEDPFSRPAKSLEDPPISTNKKLGIACHPSYVGGIHKRISVQALLGVNVKPY
jgi:hypothetical protein